MFQQEGRKNDEYNVLVLFPSIVRKHSELEPSNRKRPLSIIPNFIKIINIVGYTLTLL